MKTRNQWGVSRVQMLRVIFLPPRVHSPHTTGNVHKSKNSFQVHFYIRPANWRDGIFQPANHMMIMWVCFCNARTTTIFPGEITTCVRVIINVKGEISQYVCARSDYTAHRIPSFFFFYVMPLQRLRSREKKSYEKRQVQGIYDCRSNLHRWTRFRVSRVPDSYPNRVAVDIRGGTREFLNLIFYEIRDKPNSKIRNKASIDKSLWLKKKYLGNYKK